MAITSHIGYHQKRYVHADPGSSGAQQRVIPAHLAAQGGIGGRLNDVPRAQAANPKPTPRLADGKPDLGNGKGAWNPRTIVNLSGTGTGGPNRSPVEKLIEVPFKPEAKKIYDRASGDAFERRSGGAVPASRHSAHVCDAVSVPDLPAARPRDLHLRRRGACVARHLHRRPAACQGPQSDVSGRCRSGTGKATRW